MRAAGPGGRGSSPPRTRGSSVAISSSWSSASISSSYSKNSDSASAIYCTSSFISSSYSIMFITSSGTQPVYLDDQYAFTYNPGTDELSVPNISSSYIITVDPSVPQQVATKNYVDNLNPQGLDYYFRSASADVSGYEYMFKLDHPLSASTSVIVVPSVSASQYFVDFISPALNISNISQGTINVHFHLYRVGGAAS